MRPKRFLPLVVVAAASSLVTAGALAIPALADDRDGPLRELDACLQEHGFDLRPENGRVEVRVTPDGVWVNGERVDADAFREAQRECRPALPDFVPPPLDPETLPPGLRERMEQFRDCLEPAPVPGGEI